MTPCVRQLSPDPSGASGAGAVVDLRPASYRSPPRGDDPGQLDRPAPYRIGEGE